MSSNQISAKIIADSKTVDGKRITTFELEYHRYIHGEIMTHRLFSRNAASSRAIPVSKVVDMVKQSPATPVHWGKNQPGMRADEELDGDNLESVKSLWKSASQLAFIAAEGMHSEGAHKQIVNRLLEPFQIIKTVVTATEFDNFFWLRCHADAQPEIKMLAELMRDALKDNECLTNQLEVGMWHTPYYGQGFWEESCDDSLEDALAISSSCCAQVSYRLLDDSLEKARKVYQRLVESTPVHASPFEHQATPINKGNWRIDEGAWEDGVTHMDRDGDLWSGNFKGWVQHRQLIEGNVFTKEVV